MVPPISTVSLASFSFSSHVVKFWINYLNVSTTSALKDNQNVVMPFLWQINVYINNNKPNCLFEFLCALINFKNVTSNLAYRKCVACIAAMQVLVYSSKAFQRHHGQQLWQFHLSLLLELCHFLKNMSYNCYHPSCILQLISVIKCSSTFY